MPPKAIQRLAAESKKRKYDEVGETPQDPLKATKPRDVFRQKVLVLSSRGVTHRMRHIMNDLSILLPHAKKDAKLDSKHQLYMVNELAELSSCNNALFFEARRHQDLYLWAAKTPNGPSVRFHVLNSHTMDEMKMTGNCLRGSRPIITFDKTFDTQPHWRLIKELFTHIFAVPHSAKKAKPFVDHVTSFSIADNKIWFRNYQIVESTTGEVSEMDLEASLQALNSSNKSMSSTKKRTAPKLTLSEIGPRFVLQPIKIFEGSFNGATLFENEAFVPPAQLIAAQRAQKAVKYINRKEGQQARQEKLANLESKKIDDPLEKRRLFA